VLKTNINISPLFFAVLTAFLLTDKSGTASAAVIFSILHEAGHFLALLCEKSYPKEINISLFGINMSLSEKLSTAEKCAVLMAGFIMNFILTAFLFFIGNYKFAYINLFIGFFTAMPVPSSDGGSIIKLIFDECMPEKSEKILKTVSLSFILLLSAFMIFVLIITKNVFLIFALVYMFLCAIKTAAY